MARGGVKSAQHFAGDGREGEAREKKGEREYLGQRMKKGREQSMATGKECMQASELIHR